MAELDQIIFFDFEMLCSNRGLAYENMEAIRLGAVKYNIHSKEVTYFDRYIKPTNFTGLTKFCTDLTGIVDSDLENALDFKTVFAEFLDWTDGIKHSRFFSWSKSDLSRLKLDSVLHDIPETTVRKIENRYVDFQAIFTKRVSKTNMSVENALALYGLTFIGDAHHPMYDAYNTLRIYLNYATKHLETDLIMLSQFGFGPVLDDEKLLATIKNEIALFLCNLNDIYYIKDAQKVIKNAKKMIRKYENILLNRSGIFSEEIIQPIRMLIEFYQELKACYKEHKLHSSEIVIFHQHMTQPIRTFALSS